MRHFVVLPFSLRQLAQHFQKLLWGSPTWVFLAVVGALIFAVIILPTLVALPLGLAVFAFGLRRDRSSPRFGRKGPDQARTFGLGIVALGAIVKTAFLVAVASWVIYAPWKLEGFIVEPSRSCALKVFSIVNAADCGFVESMLIARVKKANLLAPPGKDPFARGARLRMISTTDGRIFYSVGPDGLDDGLSVIYDPTNGTWSKGDIVVFCQQDTGASAPRRDSHARDRDRLR